MYDFEKLYQAANVQDAVAALSADPQAVLICGGSDVLIKIREGKLAGCSLISIRGIPELEGVSMEADGTIVISPATTFTHVSQDVLIRRHLPMLGEAVEQVGGPQIRNVGTIGGNVCNGVTSADSASTLLAMNAVLELTGPGGVRLVPITQFYSGPGRTVRAHEELLTAVRIAKADYEGFGGHYIKFAQRSAMDIATLGCAAYVRLDRTRRAIADLRLAFGVAAPTPIRCTRTEEAAKGQPISPDLLQLAADTAVTEVNPRTSWRASRAFRLQLVHELSKRAFRQAIRNAGGDMPC